MRMKTILCGPKGRVGESHFRMNFAGGNDGGGHEKGSCCRVGDWDRLLGTGTGPLRRKRCSRLSQEGKKWGGKLKKFGGEEDGGEGRSGGGRGERS